MLDPNDTSWIVILFLQAIVALMVLLILFHVATRYLI